MLRVVFPGSCKEIQTELVIPQSDLTWFEAGANQHGPQIAFVIIHFVIVDLYFRAESELECGELEESLSPPRRDIHQQQPRASEQAPRTLDDKLWLSQVFQHRDEHDDIHGFAFEFWQDLFDCPLMEREFLQHLQLRRDLKIHPDATLQLWFQRDQLRGTITTAAFEHFQIVAAGQMPANRAMRQPHSEPIDGGQSVLTITFLRPQTHCREVGITRFAISISSVKQNVWKPRVTSSKPRIAGCEMASRFNPSLK